MKVFYRYIIDYFKEDFKWQPHLIVAIFLGIACYFNYTIGYDGASNFYDSLLKNNYQEIQSILGLFIFYSIPFLLTILIVSFFKKENKPVLNKRFIIFGLIGILFLSTDCSYYLMKFIYPYLSKDLFVGGWQKSCISNLSSFITIILPLYILYFSVRHFKPEFYGLKLNGVKVLPYFWLILFMIPLIWLASQRPDFLDAYPTYVDRYEYMFLDTEQWKTVSLYELCYGFDFLSVELFFRGFMVVALSKFVGKDAVLPMVVVYCFLHFGKPAGEAISSIFGGYILGILAYKSRNIFGGLIAHLGVAWGMELLAYLAISGN